jgi:hypothetical protein
MNKKGNGFSWFLGVFFFLFVMGEIMEPSYYDLMKPSYYDIAMGDEYYGGDYSPTGAYTYQKSEPKPAPFDWIRATEEVCKNHCLTEVGTEEYTYRNSDSCQCYYTGDGWKDQEGWELTEDPRGIND